MKPLDLVFWPAPMRRRRFEEHLRAAVAGGFSSLAIAAPTYFEARARGLSAQDLKAMARDAGVPLRHLDTLMTWAPVQQRFEDEDIAAPP